MYKIKSYLGDVNGQGTISKLDDKICNALFDFAKNNPNKSGAPKKASTKIRPFEGVYRKGAVFLTREEANEWADDETKKKLENKLRTFLESLSTYEAEIEKYLAESTI